MDPSSVGERKGNLRTVRLVSSPDPATAPLSISASAPQWCQLTRCPPAPRWQWSEDNYSDCSHTTRMSERPQLGIMRSCFVDLPPSAVRRPEAERSAEHVRALFNATPMSRSWIRLRDDQRRRGHMFRWPFRLRDGSAAVRRSTRQVALREPHRMSRKVRVGTAHYWPCCLVLALHTSLWYKLVGFVSRS
jgi:hypothetical protein